MLTRQALDKVMKLDNWSTYSLDAKVKIARNVVSATREKARNYLILENKDLRKRIEAAAIERRRRLLGKSAK